ncbi:phosphatase PAP2 family protein [Cognatilysobacter lacus]|nr:phosphatase PAP2 family protein [Lysobacter lacus]
MRPEPDPAAAHVALPTRMALVAAMAAANGAIYLAINLHPLSTPRILPAGAIEAALGRHAWTIWPYWLLLLLAPMLAVGISERRVLVATLRSYAIALGLNVAIWLAWPTRLPRQAWPDAHDPATADAWHLLLALDRDTNCFPSGHVTIPIVIAAGFCVQHPGLRRWVAVLIAVLLPSVVTTGQHYAVDIVGGAATACAGLAFGARELWPRAWAERLERSS